MRGGKAALGWRVSFALPGAGSGIGRRSIAGVLRALAGERQRVVTTWLDTYRS